MKAYGFRKTTDLSYEQAVEKVTQELGKEGFGVLTTIDIRETLKKKLDVDVPRYIILGACNPPFAHKALQAEQEVGMLLPCNVVVYDDGGTTTIGMFDPLTITRLSENPSLRQIAEEVESRLRRVLDAC